MTSKRPSAAGGEYEPVQQYAPTIEGASVKYNKRNLPVVVFAHGSGAPSTSEWMLRWRNLLANALNAVEVVTFDYPYINGGKKVAPKPEKLVGFHSDIVREVAAKYPEHPLILVGKSMGSKISCMVAGENEIEASAVVCLGYPLKAAKGAVGDKPLLQLTVPIMFVQGGHDFFCPLNLLEVIRTKLKASNALHVIENGDQSFQIAKKNLELTGMTREKAEQCAVEAIAVFVSQITSEKVFNGHRASVWPMPVVVLIMVVHLVSHLLVSRICHFFHFAGKRAFVFFSVAAGTGVFTYVLGMLTGFGVVNCLWVAQGVVFYLCIDCGMAMLSGVFGIVSWPLALD